MRGFYDPERFAKSREYLIATSRFQDLARTLQLAALLAFLLAGGFGTVDAWARALTPSPILRGLAFAGVLLALKSLLTLPLGAWSIFVIEERFGFNRTTWRTFVGDRVKGVILGILLGAPAFAAVIWFFEHAGPRGWIAAWAALTAIQLLAMFLAPALILPLFNQFSPLPDGPLKQDIEGYLRANRFEVSGVFTMDGSKRSTKANAFFTGFGRFRRLVFFDTLLEKNDHEEIMAVLAHEVGHFREKHIPRFAALSILTSFLLFAALGWILRDPRLHAAFGVSTPSTYAGLIFAGILYSPILRFLGMGTQWLSRRFEFQADRWSVRTYGHADKLASALKRLSADSLSHLTPHRLKIWLDYTHPPVLERVRALHAMGGATGRGP
jgi:STE24 endopeptidase